MHKFILLIGSALLALSISAHEGDHEAELEELIEEIREQVTESIAQGLHGSAEIVQEIEIPHMVESHLRPLVLQIRDRASLGLVLAVAEDQLVVQDFAPFSTAQEDGIEIGDVLVGLDDQVFTGEEATIEHVIKYLQTIEPGTTVQAHVQRGDVKVEVAVETHKHSPRMSWGGNRGIFFGSPGRNFRDGRQERIEGWVERMPYFDQGRRARGMGDVQVTDMNDGLSDYFEVDSGVLVLEAEDNSELRAGDVIIGVGDEDVTNSEELFAMLHELDGEVTVQRGRKTVQLTLDEVLAGLGLEREVAIYTPDRRERRAPRRDRGGISW